MVRMNDVMYYTNSTHTTGNEATKPLPLRAKRTYMFYAAFYTIFTSDGKFKTDGC